MSDRRSKPQSPREGIAEGLEEQIERTDDKARRPLGRTRALGEMQRDPERTVREAPKPRHRKPEQ